MENVDVRVDVEKLGKIKIQASDQSKVINYIDEKEDNEEG